MNTKNNHVSQIVGQFESLIKEYQGEDLVSKISLLAQQAEEQGDIETGALLLVEAGARVKDVWDESALGFFRKSITLAEKTKNLGILVRSHLEIATRLELIGKIDEAIENAIIAEAYAEELGDLTIWIVSLLTLSRLFKWGGRLEESKQAAEMAVAHAHEANDRRSIGICLRYLAEALISNGEMERAQEVANASLLIAEEVGDPLGIVHALGLLGCCSIVLGNGEDAMKYISKLKEKVKDHGYEDTGLSFIQAHLSLAGFQQVDPSILSVQSSDPNLSAIIASDMFAVLAIHKRDIDDMLVNGVLQKINFAPIPRIRILALTETALGLWVIGKYKDACDTAIKALEMAKSYSKDLVAGLQSLVEQMTSSLLGKMGKT